MNTIRNVVLQLKSAAVSSVAEDWQSALPAGSKWRPGDLGDPACPECHGVGYMRLDMPIGHPVFGKLFICECAEIGLQAAMTARLQQASKLSDQDLALTWGNVVLTDDTKPAMMAVRATLNAGFGWCYIWGPSGPGKTQLLKATVAECIRAGTPAVYANWADLLEHLRLGYDAGDFNERVERWRTVPVLVVDEFGRAHDTEWVREAQARIFNHRYESAIGHDTITLFGSNFPPEQGDEWFADRARDGRFKVIQMTGPSLRPFAG
jgi:DNA replication protein DnaC